MQEATKKPEVSLWLLGEDSYKQQLTISLGKQPIESEQRSYTLLYNQGDALYAPGVLLVFGATQTITPKLKAQLLLSSRFTNNIFVILTDCELLKTEKALDQTERNLRRNLSEQGFDGDSATILQFPQTRLGPQEITRVLTRLDELPGLLSAPPKKPRTFPKGHPNAPLAKLMMQLNDRIVPAARMELKKNTIEKLYAQPISTQFGGMPYLEKEEKWPKCARCRSNASMKFLWQIDARPFSEGALGLYTFYYCEAHSSFEVRHYPAPSVEKRQAIRQEASLTFQSTGTPLGPYQARLWYEPQAPASGLLRADKFWTTLQKSNPKKKAETLYRELLASLGAVEATSVATLVEPPSNIPRWLKQQIKKETPTLPEHAKDPKEPQLGGIYYTGGDGNEGLPCGTCGSPLQTLALFPVLNTGALRLAKFLYTDRKPPEHVRLLPCFVCRCDPGRVELPYLTNRALGDLNYNNDLDDEDFDDYYYDGWE